MKYFDDSQSLFYFPVKYILERPTWTYVRTYVIQGSDSVLTIQFLVPVPYVGNFIF